MAGGNPAKLVEGTSRITTSEPQLVFALAHSAQQKKSKWQERTDKGRPLATNGVKVASIAELAAAVLKLRKLYICLRPPDWFEKTNKEQILSHIKNEKIAHTPKSRRSREYIV